MNESCGSVGRSVVLTADRMSFFFIVFVFVFVLLRGLVSCWRRRGFDDGMEGLWTDLDRVTRSRSVASFDDERV